MFLDGSNSVGVQLVELSPFSLYTSSLSLCHKLCDLTASQCARHVIKTTTIKEEDVTFYSSYFVVTTLTVVTLCRDQRGQDIMSEEEIKKWRSIRGAYKGHCTQDFKRAEKLITSETPDQAELEALVDRLTRRAEEIARMDAMMSLETEEDIQLDTETALSFQDDISYWQFKIGRLLKSKFKTRTRSTNACQFT